METKGLICKIPLDLHNQISEEIRETESNMSKFIEMVIREHYQEGGKRVLCEMRGKNRGRGDVLRAVRHAGTKSGTVCTGTTLAGAGATAAGTGSSGAGAICGVKGCNSNSHMPCSWNYIEFSREQLYDYGADCGAACCCRYNSFPYS